jgi:drug/metabolite transporter (DMT)-like permease
MGLSRHGCTTGERRQNRLIGPEALAITYGISSAITWGAGDFSAGFASRKSGVVSVVLFSQLIGAGFLVLLAIFFSGALPSLRDMAFGGLAGLCDIMGNMFFALATNLGRLDISAMLSSLFPAATVSLAWFFLKEKLNRYQWFGVAVALVALILISA